MNFLSSDARRGRICRFLLVRCPVWPPYQLVARFLLRSFSPSSRFTLLQAVPFVPLFIRDAFFFQVVSSKSEKLSEKRDEERAKEAEHEQATLKKD